jgi:hypothetical protein
MKKERGWFQISAGLVLFLSFVVLVGCSTTQHETEEQMQRANVVECPVNVTVNPNHCHKMWWCNHCRSGTSVHWH